MSDTKVLKYAYEHLLNDWPDNNLTGPKTYIKRISNIF